MDTTRFAVHEYPASHLQDDLGLKMGGVPRSWAVPKGPPMSPADKRRTMLVEDHSLEYAMFEGIIPAEMCGAGPVVISDEDAFEPLGDLEAALEKGRLALRLEGKYLRGEFAPAHLRGRGTAKEWLLMKQRGDFAAAGWKLLTAAKRRHCKSGRPPARPHRAPWSPRV